MTTFERIKNLSDQKKISLQKVAIDIGLSENAIYGWKTRKPKGEDLAKVAKYFNVSVDYLLGLDTTKPKQTKVDLAAVADDDEPNWDDWLSAGGKPLTESDKIALKLMFYGRGKSGKK